VGSTSAYKYFQATKWAREISIYINSSTTAGAHTVSFYLAVQGPKCQIESAFKKERHDSKNRNKNHTANS
jgi:hypothetical protein